MAQSATMSLSVACRRFLAAPAGNTRSANKAQFKKHGPAPNACRERRKNSNASFVRPLIHSGFIAAIRPPTLEIFYRKFPASCSTRRSKPYPGANPKARSKRLT
jgi:hypothetical protein